MKYDDSVSTFQEDGITIQLLHSLRQPFDDWYRMLEPVPLGLQEMSRLWMTQILSLHPHPLTYRLHTTEIIMTYQLNYIPLMISIQTSLLTFLSKTFLCILLDTLYERLLNKSHVMYVNLVSVLPLSGHIKNQVLFQMRNEGGLCSIWRCH